MSDSTDLRKGRPDEVYFSDQLDAVTYQEPMTGTCYLRTTGGGGGGGDATRANQDTQISIANNQFAEALTTNAELSNIRDSIDVQTPELTNIKVNTRQTHLAVEAVQFTYGTGVKAPHNFGYLTAYPVSAGGTATFGAGIYSLVAVIDKVTFLPVPLLGSFGSTLGIDSLEFMSCQNYNAKGNVTDLNITPEFIAITKVNAKTLGNCLRPSGVLLILASY
jgi:hypothetical protein